MENIINSALLDVPVKLESHPKYSHVFFERDEEGYTFGCRRKNGRMEYPTKESRDGYYVKRWKTFDTTKRKAIEFLRQ